MEFVTNNKNTETLIIFSRPYSWYENHPLKTLKLNIFFTFLPIENVRCSTFLTIKSFYYRIIANLPLNATAIVKFLETYDNWVF